MTNKSKHQKILKFIIASSLAIGLNGIAHGATLKLATDSANRDSPTGESLVYWGERIEEYSNNEIEVELYFQNELGTQQEVFDLLMGGAIDGMLTWPMTNYDRRIGIVYTPYMLTDWEDALEAYSPDGWLYSLLNDVMNENDLKFLGPWPEGFNGIATAGQCITDIEDNSNLNIRTIPVYPFPQVVQALGYQTAAIDWTELYTALQTGVVSGDAGNVIYHDYEYFRDILDCYVRTKHMFMTAMFLMHNDSFSELSEEQQQAVYRASEDAVAKQFNDGLMTDELYVERAIDYGMEYVELDSDSLRNNAEIVREAIWPTMRSQVGADLMDVIEENAGEF
ncbi:TRAP transporter substrate-binding protein DctP [Halomonas salifodinae]|uniref:TRAP transporter substrate-binding protein DctP n=1 Tax=Halomonas salifodinae TaxID=438745 RepID=A0ABW2F3C0_9GAMM